MTQMAQMFLRFRSRFTSFRRDASASAFRSLFCFLFKENYKILF
jgi:hypothetical protein